jgi:RNA polymerase sigma-70 factor (ECF subfamily)
MLRRRGRQINVPIEDVIDTLAAEEQTDGLEHNDIERMLGRLNEQQRDIVQSISVKGFGVRETASRLQMTEGAVRVALHRALKALAALYRSDST